MTFLVNLAAIRRDGISDEINRIDAVLGNNKSLLRDLAELAELFASIRLGLPAIKLKAIKIGIADEFEPKFLTIRSGKIEFVFQLDGKEWAFKNSNI